MPIHRAGYVLAAAMIFVLAIPPAEPLPRQLIKFWAVAARLLTTPCRGKVDRRRTVAVVEVGCARQRRHLGPWTVATAESATICKQQKVFKPGIRAERVVSVRRSNRDLQASVVTDRLRQSAACPDHGW